MHAAKIKPHAAELAGWALKSRVSLGLRRELPVMSNAVPVLLHAWEVFRKV